MILGGGGEILKEASRASTACVLPLPGGGGGGLAREAHTHVIPHLQKNFMMRCAEKWKRTEHH